MLGIIFLVIRLLAAIALFAFLGWALYLIWLGLKQQSSAQAQFAIPGLALAPLDDHAFESYRTVSPEVMVGRDPACDLCLKDHTISAQHARLAYNLGQWWVQDLHSTNGTHLNGQPISEAMVLTSGDELCFGQISFSVSIEKAL
jgi:pSer/pThr/pTyr-binding forkhead associated (FHA) protein